MTTLDISQPTCDNAPSPFLPGTNIQFAWDSTSLGWLKTCPRLYQYSMIENWRTKGESVHLRFGIEYHQALQDYEIYRSESMDHEGAVSFIVKNLLHSTHGWHSDHKQKNRSTLL